MKSERVFPHSLFKAIRDGDEDVMMSLLNGRSVRLDEVINKDGETPLSRAARAKKATVAASMCTRLIERGASPSVRERNGRTPLIMMVFARSAFHRSVAELLRSSVDERDNEGKTALMFAAKGRGFSGKRGGNLGVLEHLIDLGANPLIEDNAGVTALGYAIRSNDKDTNGAAVAFLKDAMRTRVALEVFVKEYKHGFDQQGRITYKPVKGR